MRTPIWLVLAFVAGAAVAIGFAWGWGQFDDARAQTDTNPGEDLGVAVRDDRAHGGYILIAPIGAWEARLIDQDGEVLHTWDLPNPVASGAQLLPDGSLMFVARQPAGGNPGTPGEGGGFGLVRLSWDGEVEWSAQDIMLHHDFAVLPDGTVATLRWVPLSADFGAQIAGGIPDSEFEGRVWGDQVIEIPPDGALDDAVVVFDSEQAMVPGDHPLPEWERRGEWTHANALAYLPSDPINGEEAYLLSHRQISTVMIVSRASGEVIWQYGGQWVLNQQHDPTLLDNGNVLLFDNGQYLRARPSSSQVIEIDPRTDEIVWSYPAERVPFTDFYSSITSGAQRLPNGNTLITLGVPKRLVEVTTDGEVVWDYRDPTDPDGLFRADSYPPEMVDPLLSR